MSSTRVTVKSEIKVEVKPEVKLEGTSDLQHIDTSTWKTGQKFPTPSPGNGGILITIVFLVHELLIV